METYGKILLIAMPAFLLLVLAEKWYGWYKGKETVETTDMVSSLLSGVTNVTKDVLGLSIAIYSYGWMVKNFALVEVKNTIATYFIAFFALDFMGYWTHRIAHEYNFFWNAHLVHHSSESYNLACALRQSISSFVKIFTFFLLPAALLGVPEEVIAIVAPLHLFAQFWYHTEHIGRMGFLEKIIVTPSHHRVHHAINPIYLDKNYSQILIFWDKLFGTFQLELEQEKPVYGITRPVRTWNPIRINFQHLWLLIKDAWNTASFKDKLRIWLMPTGWRPQDVVAKYPVYKIDDIYHFDKYGKPLSAVEKTWLWFQLVVLLLLVSFLFGNIAIIGKPAIFYYGFFIFVYVYALAEYMDGNRTAILWEVLKFFIGISLLMYTSDWFGLGKLYAGAHWAVVAYLFVSLGFTFYSFYRNNSYKGLQQG